jgi:predicted nuclease of predicted toxin-antitoxin system
VNLLFDENLPPGPFPPKVIWLRIGNATTKAVEIKLRAEAPAIAAFLQNYTLGVLELR